MAFDMRHLSFGSPQTKNTCPAFISGFHFFWVLRHMSFHGFFEVWISMASRFVAESWRWRRGNLCLLLGESCWWTKHPRLNPTSHCNSSYYDLWWKSWKKASSTGWTLGSCPSTEYVSYCDVLTLHLIGCFSPVLFEPSSKSLPMDLSKKNERIW